MSRFIQLHLLTSYPPANLNRDDLGRPKTAVMGGAPRLRVSSQSLKRAWRTSDVFENALKDHIGTRTKEMGVRVYQQLIEKDIKKKDAIEWAKLIAGQFGMLEILSAKEKKKLKEMDDDERMKKELSELEIKQLAHFSPEEERLIDELVATIAGRESKPEDKELALLRKSHTAADIALFGRMLTKSNYGNSLVDFCSEAAVQVAHAISVHSVVVEDDFFTAVDDLNNGEDDVGAAHLGEAEFAAGLFYLYLCIDKELLVKNLSGDEELANKTLAALVESAATVAPTGKQNSFASRARASYLLCETGNQQPRSLSVAYLKPVNKSDVLDASIKQLNESMDNMDKVYGACADKRCSMNALAGEGNLLEITQCVTEA